MLKSKVKQVVYQLGDFGSIKLLGFIEKEEYETDWGDSVDYREDLLSVIYFLITSQGWTFEK